MEKRRKREKGKRKNPHPAFHLSFHRGDRRDRRELNNLKKLCELSVLCGKCFLSVLSDANYFFYLWSPEATPLFFLYILRLGSAVNVKSDRIPFLYSAYP